MDNSLFAYEHLCTKTSHRGDHVQGCSHADAGVRCHYFTAYCEAAASWDLSAGGFVSLLPGRQVRTVSGPLPAATPLLAVTNHSAVQFIPGGDLRSASFTSEFSLSLGQRRSEISSLGLCVFVRPGSWFSAQSKQWHYGGRVF